MLERGINNLFLNTTEPTTPGWNILAPLLGLSFLLLAGGAYASHLILRQFSATKAATLPQPDILRVEGKEQYHQLQLYHKHSPGMVHQVEAGYSTPGVGNTGVQAQGGMHLNRSVSKKFGS